MGKWRNAWRKHTVEECFNIDIHWLKKHGYLRHSQGGTITWSSAEKRISSIGIQSIVTGCPEAIRIAYTSTNTVTGKKEDVDCTFPLFRTPCNYGGSRYWFKCQGIKNGVHCGKRVGKLYQSPGNFYFLCRHCYELSYYLRQKNRALGYDCDRIQQKIDKLKQRMGKKGIHRRTYQKLEKEHMYLTFEWEDYFLLGFQRRTQKILNSSRKR